MNDYFWISSTEIWYGKLQSAYNELRFDVGTILAMHKYFVFRLLILAEFPDHIFNDYVLSQCV